MNVGVFSLTGFGLALSNASGPGRTFPDRGRPLLLLLGDWGPILVSVTTAMTGVVALAAAIAGCVWTSLGVVARVLVAARALLMLYPRLASDAGGFAVILFALWISRLRGNAVIPDIKAEEEGSN
jgi:TRAP-type uncharacterized transport system fused permease subunit